MTLTHPVSLQVRPDLADLLARAAAGDIDAFMEFYDATSACALTLAMARTRLLGVDRESRRGVAEREVELLYAEAWRRCSEQPRSGLSPRAWLLTLPLGSTGRACA